jgi:hypothetical protein
MGALAAARLARDGVSGVIRPVGGCDVLALLSSRTLRRHLAAADGSGMRSVAVPTRRRGWFDITRVDPAFVRAAWSLTDEFAGLTAPPDQSGVIRRQGRTRLVSCSVARNRDPWGVSRS